MHYAALCFVCLVIVTLMILREQDGHCVQAVLLKGLASLCFVVMGWLCAAHVGWPDPANLIVLGLMLGAAADVLLELRKPFPKAKKRFFLIGCAVFLCGHIAYLSAVLPLCSRPLLSALAALALTALLTRRLFRVVRADRSLKLAGAVYLCTVVFLNCVAAANLLAFASGFNALFALGALLFLASDILLILYNFGGEGRFAYRFVNLGLYYTGQLLIALSCLYLR